MVKKIINLIKSPQFKELVLYVIFGVLTTLVNWIVYFIFVHILGVFIENDSLLALISNPPAWIAGVVFAFVTNKLWVFNSKSWSKKVLAKEIPEFVGARAVTGLLEEFGLPLLLMIPFFKNFDWTISLVGKEFDITNQVLAKVLIAVIVVVLNYVFSKLIIFKEKPEEVKEEDSFSDAD